ncbi:hypothetical protein C8R21_11617 [Nitrosospira multiformis]|uniref:UPF0235 protein C8R21_11617 n=1 Tax=Nitrosospira multiformis TaxID=1231 RepID=A0A2T5I986_9PROT|nr:DUF167 family protein [Nitrosospira multiformis]PTQ80386.1 hypothetical protein C8R21_11617 [Nitrosospira multiformis]
MEIASSDEWYRSDDTGKRLILTLHIQPGARRTEVVGPHGDALKIKLAAPRVEGAANAALLAFLAGVFGVPQRQVILRQGARSRRKIVEIDGMAYGADILLKQAAS